jgi:hypothetical protein
MKTQLIIGALDLSAFQCEFVLPYPNYDNHLRVIFQALPEEVRLSLEEIKEAGVYVKTGEFCFCFLGRISFLYNDLHEGGFHTFHFFARAAGSEHVSIYVRKERES